MKNKMYMIYCDDTYITCFIDSKDFIYEVIKDGNDVRVAMTDLYYNYKSYVYYCNCHFIIKET